MRLSIVAALVLVAHGAQAQTQNVTVATPSGTQGFFVVTRGDNTLVLQTTDIPASSGCPWGGVFVCKPPPPPPMFTDVPIFLVPVPARTCLPPRRLQRDSRNIVFCR